MAAAAFDCCNHRRRAGRLNLGVLRSLDGRIETDARYAARGLVAGRNQIAVAMAQAEITAADVHSRLRLSAGLCLEAAAP